MTEREDKRSIDIYTERAILLRMLTWTMFRCHLNIHDGGDPGFKSLLCCHTTMDEKVLTWHISDDDLKFFNDLKVFDCSKEWMTTDDKYEFLLRKAGLGHIVESGLLG